MTGVKLTGGEPLLRPYLVNNVIDKIRRTSDAKIYIYTAKLDDVHKAHWLLKKVDGMSVTLHQQADVDNWLKFIHPNGHPGKSLRLNIFKGVELFSKDIPSEWMVKRDIEWVKDSPLPDDEVFMRLTRGRTQTKEK